MTVVSKGKIVEVDPYGNKQPQKTQYVFKAERIYEADSTRPRRAPDLLVYAPDYSSFFFCEVKGPGDTVRPKPAEFFRVIESKCGKPVVIARFIRCEPWLSVRN